MNKIWCEWSVCSMQVIHFDLNFLNHINVSGPNKTLHVYSPDSVYSYIYYVYTYISFFIFHSLLFIIWSLHCLTCAWKMATYAPKSPLLFNMFNSFLFRSKESLNETKKKGFAFRLTRMINWSHSSIIDHCVQLAKIALLNTFYF